MIAGVYFLAIETLIIIRDVVASRRDFNVRLHERETALSFLESGRLDASRQIFGRRSGLHLHPLSLCALTQLG